MRLRALSLLFVAPLLSALACGGIIEGGGGAGPRSCPSPQNVSDGIACAWFDQTCASAETQSDCDGRVTQVDCTCTSAGKWLCARGEVDCPPEPPPCPEPASIREGAACSSPSNVSCASEIPYYGCNGVIDGYVTCNCVGDSRREWSCADPGPPYCPDAPPDEGPPDAGPPEASACPDPKQVNDGVACASPGEQCPGNPQDCGGQTFYDVFECDAGAWTKIVSTGCAVDAGPVDAGQHD